MVQSCFGAGSIALIDGEWKHDDDFQPPLEDWGKLIGDVPAATAILDRFLHHAELIHIKGKSYRLRDRRASQTRPDGKSKQKPADPTHNEDEAANQT